MNYTIYKHTTPSNKVYVGITKQNPINRWRNGKGYKKNKHFFSAILKYGWENIKHEILFENLSREEATNKEIELIKQYKSNKRNYGYNNSIGGEKGALGNHHKLSLKTKKKMSIARKGENNAFYGKTHTKEVRELIRKRNLGRIAWNKDISWNNEIKNKIMLSHKERKNVICVETGIIYNSIKEANRETNINKKNISYCCRKLKHYKTAGGYHWEFCTLGGD